MKRKLSEENVLEDIPEEKRGKALSPQELPRKKLKIIPGFVFDIFNELLALELTGVTGQTITIYQNNLMEKITEYHGDASWDRNWLDVEPYYEKVGWKVKYDKPSWAEYYEPRFYFTVL